MQRTMKTSSRILSFFVALIMMSFVCLDSSFAIKAGASAVISAQSIIEDMGLGWNLGNSLDSTGNNDINGQETSYGNPVVTESLIKAVKAKGFKTIRVPVTWSGHLTRKKTQYIIDPLWLARVREVVDYAYNNDMYVILNVHHEDWINRSDFADSYDEISTELKSVWRQIAEYFSSYDQHLIFEGMNEPRAKDTVIEWSGNADCYKVVNKLNADFIKMVRAVDSKYKTTRLLMIPGYAASADYAVYSNLDKSMFAKDDYVAASVHAYKPLGFAMGEGDHSSFSADNKAELDSVFGNLRSFFTQNNIPVVIGEFSASNYGYTDARVEWAEYYMTLAKETGIACVLWDNNAISNNDDPSEAHGYINRSNNTWYSASEPVVNKLISVRNDKSIIWGSKNSYPLHPHSDYTTGTAVSIDDDGNIAVSDLNNFTSGKELAVKYTTETAPTFALMNSGWDGWTELSAYDFSYSDSGNIAYLRYDDIYKIWNSSANGELAYIKISNYEKITVDSAAILSPKATGGTGDDGELNLEIAQNRLSLCYEQSAYITENGDLYTWGRNEYGQLGDGTDIDRKTPVKIMSNVSQVSVCYRNGACVTKNGDLYTWGDHVQGVLGDGSTSARHYPKKIMSNVAQVSLGTDHIACVTINGDLYIWGNNGFNQLGTGTSYYWKTPQKLMSNVVKVSLGRDHSSCITENGDLYTWGNSANGKLGYGSNNISGSVPRKIMSNVADVCLSNSNSSCITENGDLYIWGWNGLGQIVNGTKEDCYSPQKVMSNVAKVSLGSSHIACLTTNNDLYIWGSNKYGQLGDGSDADKIKPFKLKSNISDVELGNYHSAYITDNDELYVWGFNSRGQIGDGTTIAKSRPVRIPIYAEGAPVTVSDGTDTKNFDNLETALTAYKLTTKALTITLNKDANVKTLSLPTKASGITFEGTGRLELNMTSLTVPANTTFNIEVNGTNARPLAIRVSAGKTLDINGKTSNIGAVNGAKGAVLNLNEDAEFASIATFGSVNVDSGKTLTVTSKLSAVTSLNGAVKLPTAKTTAATVTAGNAEIILVEGNIAKVTLADVTEKVNVKVVDENDEAVKLSSGTVVLYSTKDISEKVTVENTTDDGKELNAFFYKKNKAIKAEWADAVTLSYCDTHRQFPNVELALEGIKDKNTDYTLTLNTSVTEPKFVLPKTAKSITINGTGTLTTAVTSIAAPVDTTIGCTIKQSADKAIALKAAANTTLTLSAENTFGAVSGARTSALNVNENIETASIATFGSVNIAEEKVLTVSGKLSAVSSLNGAVKLPTVKTTAATVTAGNAEIILVEGNIAKVTLADITTTVNVRVVDENNDTVDLASGTVVLYSTKDISEKVTVENTTDDGKELNAFFYKKNKAIKAEWADAVTLSYGETSRKFPNAELALEAINDKTKTVDYTLTLNTNLNASALALPAYAKSVRITSADETRAIDLTNVTTISAKTPLTLENVRIESTKPFTISTTSDLTLENFVSDSIAAVRGGTKAVLELGTTSPIDKVSGFGTIKLSGEFRTGSTFTTTALELTETADLIVSNTKAAASAKTLKGAEGSVITFDSGFTPLKVTGTTADSISGAIKLRANEEVTDTTILFAAKYAGNNVFDVTEIQPDGKECVVTSISGKAYMKPIVFEFSGERYALWTDVMTVIENVKMSEAAYTVTLLDDVNVNGTLKLPRTGTYRKLTITSDSKTLSFTGNITATGELEIMNTNLNAVKNSVSCKYTISAGRNPFTSENSDLGLAGISGTADTTLKNTAMSGAVRAGKLTLNGTDTILGTITATELCSDEQGTVLNALANARGVMSITKNGITESSEEITIKLVDSDKNAVPAANKAVIASSFRGSYNGQLILSDENGVYSIVLVKGKLILADNATIAANSFDDIADDIDADLPDDETDADDTDEDTSEEETSDDSSDDDTAEDNENTEDDADDVSEEETEDGSEQNEGDADTSDDMSA